MKTTYKVFLATGILALPLTLVQAQTTGATNNNGEATGPIPAEGAATPKSPPMTMPTPTEKSTGEGMESSAPGTDQPLSTTAPAEVDSPEANTSTRPSTSPGTPQETAPSAESPARGAPMRTGPDSMSNEGSGTVQGQNKSQ